MDEFQLHNLAKSRNCQAARELLNQAQLVKKLQSLLSSRDLLRLTPIHVAAGQGDKDFVCLLVEYKANINALDGSGETALHRAATRGHVEVCKVLFDSILESGDSVCVLDGFGQSALFRAAHKGNMPLVEYFLNRAPNFFCDVLSCGEAALRAGHPDVAEHIAHGLESGEFKQEQVSSVVTFDRKGEKSVQELLDAIEEWRRTKRDLERKNSMESALVYQREPEREPSRGRDFPEAKPFARQPTPPPKMTCAGFLPLAVLHHVARSPCCRRLPLHDQIRSMGAVRIKHPGPARAEEEEEEEDRRRLEGEGRPALLDAPPPPTGAEARAESPRSGGSGREGGGATAAAAWSWREDGNGGAVFDFDIALGGGGSDGGSSGGGSGSRSPSPDGGGGSASASSEWSGSDAEGGDAGGREVAFAFDCAQVRWDLGSDGGGGESDDDDDDGSGGDSSGSSDGDGGA